MISSGQIRAARSLLGIKQSELAKAAGISLATLNNIERDIGDPRASTMDAITQALAHSGISLEADQLSMQVSLDRMARPQAHDTLLTSQRILEFLSPASLLKVERVIFFIREQDMADKNSDPAIDPGDDLAIGDTARHQHRICLLLQGRVREILYDQVSFSLQGAARTAEVAGIMLGAFAMQRGRVFFCPAILEDTTKADLVDAITHIKGEDLQPLRLPQDFLALAGNWPQLDQLYGQKPGHPLFQLNQFAARLQG